MTDMDHSNAEILVHLEYLRQGVDGINDRLDNQNGRIRTLENEMAVVKDRQTEARQDGGKWGGIAGGFAGGLVSAIAHYFGSPK